MTPSGSRGGRPDLDALTRDYPGFRRQILALIDRTRTAWGERSAADHGIVLVELLAYHLDHLAYAGDKGAAEGFLRTARQPESVRRHAALGDFQPDRGNASHGFQHFRLRAGAALHLRRRTRVAAVEHRAVRTVFETTSAVHLDSRRNLFYLPLDGHRGHARVHLAPACGAGLDLRALGLVPGMNLLFQSCHAAEVVRIAEVGAHEVCLHVPLQHEYSGGGGMDATRVLGNLVPIRQGRTSAWRIIGLGGASERDLDDRAFLLGFIQTLRRLRDEVDTMRNVWVGDLVLAERWRRAINAIVGVIAQLGPQPDDPLPEPTCCRDPIPAANPVVAAGHARILMHAQIQPLQDAARELQAILCALGCRVPSWAQDLERVPMARQVLSMPAGAVILWSDEEPALEVLVREHGHWLAWHEVADFLRSTPADRHYVLEQTLGGSTLLRFGDGVHGALVPPGAPVAARWVCSPGAVDVECNTLTELLHTDETLRDAIEHTSNPLPTQGARPPVALDEVPDRLRDNLARTVVPVTADDYVRMMRARVDVADAAVVGRHGCWMDMVILPADGVEPGTTLQAAQTWVRAVRLIGTRVRVSLACALYIHIAILVEVAPGVAPGTVTTAVRNRIQAHLGTLRLGRSLRRAALYGIASAVPGVRWCEIRGFAPASVCLPVSGDEIVPAPDQVIRCLPEALEIELTGPEGSACTRAPADAPVSCAPQCDPGEEGL